MKKHWLSLEKNTITCFLSILASNTFCHGTSDQKSKRNLRQFNLLPGDRVTGSYSFHINSNDLDEPNLNSLKGVGFIEEKNGLVMNGKIDGKYYSAKNLEKAESFNHSYSITLARESSIPAPIKAALTPVTIAADGVMFIGGAALIGLICTGHEVTSGKKCFPGGL